MIINIHPLPAKTRKNHLRVFYFVAIITVIDKVNSKGYDKMSSKKQKFDGSGTHRRAIYHLIGQSQTIFGDKVKISEIAQWMNVSKPTARKHIKWMVDNREVIVTTKPYKNTFVCLIELHPDVMRDYDDGLFVLAYKLYAQRVMKVTI